MDIELESKTIQKFVAKGNFHAAMNLAISAVNECRRNTDQVGTNHFLNMIKDIANKMADEFG